MRKSAEVNLQAMKDLEKIPSSILPENSIELQRNSAFLSISFVPIRKNDENGNLSKNSYPSTSSMKSGRILKQLEKVHDGYMLTILLLSTGTWYKMSIPLSGIYIIQAKDLKNIDPAFSTIDPAPYRSSAMTVGMLPEANATPRIDDLRELSIQIVGTDPTKLNDNDYIIFYAKGPDTWQYNNTDQLFHHQKNLYSNYSYCFLTYGQASRKEIVAEPSVTDPREHDNQPF